MIAAIDLPSLEATRRLGQALGAALPPEAVVLCRGKLGAGKTTLIKAICAGLGIRPETVISPTYTLVNVYPAQAPVYHVDLYRLTGPDDLLDLDRADWLNPEGPTLIEWPEAAEPHLAGVDCLDATLTGDGIDHDRRQLTLSAESALYDPVFRTLNSLNQAHGTPG